MIIFYILNSYQKLVYKISADEKITGQFLYLKKLQFSMKKKPFRLILK